MTKTPAYFAHAKNNLRARVIRHEPVLAIGDAQGCAHKWLEVGRVGRCLTTYTCAHCGAISTLDSSD